MKALVVDDEAMVRETVADVLRADGWTVSEADSAERAFEMLGDDRWSLVFCDVVLGGEDGFAVLRRFKEEQPDAEFVLMTGQASGDGALYAGALGAYDYLPKPFDIRDVLARAAAVRERVINRASRTAQDITSGPTASRQEVDLVGRSAAFVEMMKLVGRVAVKNLPVLITGESGTGKEVVARAIHRRSPRAAKAFVAVNCGAFASELIESELFGHVRGSFTGATVDRTGLLEEANGGTVFLDEITETTLAFQVKLLRALQEGEIRRVGSNRTMHVNVRFIAASNLDIEQEVRENRFRQDLLFRLNAVTLRLPPLRERREDILPLAEHFAERIAGRLTPLRFSGEAVELLESYTWPGNIRELYNAVERAAALCDHTVHPEDLPERIRNFSSNDSAEAQSNAAQLLPTQPAEAWPTVNELVTGYVARVLEHTGGNKQAAARILGVDRSTIQRMMKRKGLES